MSYALALDSIHPSYTANTKFTHGSNRIYWKLSLLTKNRRRNTRGGKTNHCMVTFRSNKQPTFTSEHQPEPEQLISKLTAHW